MASAPEVYAHGGSPEVYEKSSNEEKAYDHDPNAVHVDNDPRHNLHRGLKSRQVAMIAIGGAIGTGLIIGT
jgi:amino acid transporter